MAVASSNLMALLERLKGDPNFAALCRSKTSCKAGDEAILAIMQFAAQNGYEITFAETSKSNRAAHKGVAKALRAAVHRATGTPEEFETFLKRW